MFWALSIPFYSYFNCMLTTRNSWDFYDDRYRAHMSLTMAAELGIEGPAPERILPSNFQHSAASLSTSSFRGSALPRTRVVRRKLTSDRQIFLQGFDAFIPKNRKDKLKVCGVTLPEPCSILSSDFSLHQLTISSFQIS